MADVNREFDTLQRSMAITGAPAPWGDSLSRNRARTRFNISDLFFGANRARMQMGDDFERLYSEPNVLDYLTTLSSMSPMARRLLKKQKDPLIPDDALAGINKQFDSEMGLPPLEGLGLNARVRK